MSVTPMVRVRALKKFSTDHRRPYWLAEVLGVHLGPPVAAVRSIGPPVDRRNHALNLPLFPTTDTNLFDSITLNLKLQNAVQKVMVVSLPMTCRGNHVVTVLVAVGVVVGMHRLVAVPAVEQLRCPSGDDFCSHSCLPKCPNRSGKYPRRNVHQTCRWRPHRLPVGWRKQSACPASPTLYCL